MNNLLLNKDFCEKVYDAYNERHCYEHSKLGLMELQRINEALLIGIERLLNTNPQKLLKEVSGND